MDDNTLEHTLCRESQIIMNHIDEEDEQFRQVFGECDIPGRSICTINNIKNNYPDTKQLDINTLDEILTESGWRLLGGYIARNTHLTTLDIYGPVLTDAIMSSSLFKTLTASSSLKIILLRSIDFSIEGVRSMVPFLENTELLSFSIMTNIDFDTECFEVLVGALHNKGIQSLRLNNCRVKNISALETYNLPNLQKLFFDNTITIGGEGNMIVLSNLLQQDRLSLTCLSLVNARIGDEEAELLAAALKHNTKLESISLAYNNITERGHIAFLKVLNDVSSIKNTYLCNCTLTTCNLASASSRVKTEVLSLIDLACKDNQSIDAGRAKVIRCHLNSQILKRLCQLQGVEYTSGNVFADIEPILLPKILALIGVRHGQSELYTALIHTAPDLLSYIDRKALIQDVMAKNTARAAALAAEYEQKVAALKNQFLNETSHLTAHNNDLSNRLALIKSGDGRHISEGGNKSACNSTKKRQRDA